MGLFLTHYGFFRSLSRIWIYALAQLPLLAAAPLYSRLVTVREEEDGEDPTILWIYLATAIALVLLGGAFAGLTIALMGQVSVFLE